MGAPLSRLLCHQHWDQLSVERRMKGRRRRSNHLTLRPSCAHGPTECHTHQAAPASPFCACSLLGLEGSFSPVPLLPLYLSAWISSRGAICLLLLPKTDSPLQFSRGPFPALDVSDTLFILLIYLAHWLPYWKGSPRCLTCR